MIGILVQLAISWLIIWKLEQKNLSVLGFHPTSERLKHFLGFMILTAAGCTSGFIYQMIIAKQQWIINPQWTFSLLIDGLWFTIKSILFEELIFRGVFLYILIQRIGMNWAVLISAAAFGIYHWFTYEVFDNPVAMIMVWIVTAAMGWILALGYAKTKSLYVPIAIHFGWNAVTQNIFSNGPIGNQLLMEVLPRPEVTVSYFSYLIVMYGALITTLVANFWAIRRIKSLDFTK